MNSPLIGVDTASAIRPEIDVLSPPSELLFRSLYLDFLGVQMWLNPPAMPMEHTIPTLTSLPSGELVSITLGSQQVNSDTLGSLLLTASVPIGGIADIQLTYAVNRQPQNEVYVLETRLRSTNPLVEPSGSVFIVLSPQGALHHTALHLEEYIGTRMVPEPAAGYGCVAVGGVVFAAWRRRRAA
jgi:hypothetical protein